MLFTVIRFRKFIVSIWDLICDLRTAILIEGRANEQINVGDRRRDRARTRQSSTNNLNIEPEPKEQQKKKKTTPTKDKCASCHTRIERIRMILISIIDFYCVGIGATRYAPNREMCLSTNCE